MRFCDTHQWLPIAIPLIQINMCLLASPASRSNWQTKKARVLLPPICKMARFREAIRSLRKPHEAVWSRNRKFSSLAPTTSMVRIQAGFEVVLSNCQATSSRFSNSAPIWITLWQPWWMLESSSHRLQHLQEQPTLACWTRILALRISSPSSRILPKITTTPQLSVSWMLWSSYEHHIYWCCCINLSNISGKSNKLDLKLCTSFSRIV